MSKRTMASITATGLIVLSVAVAGLVAGTGEAAGQAKPANKTEPKISGTAVVGRTLTSNQGTWTGSPDSYAYQWVRCPKDGGKPSGSDCAAISGATTKKYVVGGGDVNRRLRVRVTASNDDGSATAASNPTALVVRAGAVTNTEPPTISGTAQVGSTLTADPGKWVGDGLRYSYSWRRCAADGRDCAAITGAKEKTYTAKQADLGNTLRVRVVARNDDRSAAATSAATQRVKKAGASVEGCPSGGGSIDIAQIGPPARLLIDRQQASPPVVRGDTTRVTVRFHVSACGGRTVRGALVYATAVPFNQFSVPPEQATDSGGWATLSMSRERGYPATAQQQLLVVFARARKAGEDVLGGVSTRRLVSFPVNLR
jgi:hypothetical protein